MLVFMDNIKARAFLASITCVFAFASLNFFKPHPNKAVLRLDTASFFCTSLKYIYVILLDPNAQENQDLALAIMFIMIDVSFSVSSVFCVLQSVKILHKQDDKNAHLGENISQKGKSGRTQVVPSGGGSRVTRRLTRQNTSSIITYGKAVSIKEDAAKSKGRFMVKMRKREHEADIRMRRRLDKRRRKHKKEGKVSTFEQIDMLRLQMAALAPGSGPLLGVFKAHENAMYRLAEKQFVDICNSVVQSMGDDDQKVFSKGIGVLAWKSAVASGQAKEQGGISAEELRTWLYHERNTHHVLAEDATPCHVTNKIRQMTAVLSGDAAGKKYVMKTVLWAAEHHTRIDLATMQKLVKKVYKKSKLSVDKDVFGKLWHEICKQEKGSTGIAETSVDALVLKRFMFPGEKEAEE